MNRFGLAAQKPTRHELTSPGPRPVHGPRRSTVSYSYMHRSTCTSVLSLSSAAVHVDVGSPPTGFLRHAAEHGSSALRHRQAACPRPALRAPIRAVAPCPAVRPHLSGVSANKAHHRRHACIRADGRCHARPQQANPYAHDRAGAHVARGIGATRASPRPPADRVHPLRRIH